MSDNEKNEEKVPIFWNVLLAIGVGVLLAILAAPYFLLVQEHKGREAMGATLRANDQYLYGKIQEARYEAFEGQTQLYKDLASVDSSLWRYADEDRDSVICLEILLDYPGPFMQALLEAQRCSMGLNERRFQEEEEDSVEADAYFDSIDVLWELEEDLRYQQGFCENPREREPIEDFDEADQQCWW